MKLWRTIGVVLLITIGVAGVLLAVWLYARSLWLNGPGDGSNEVRILMVGNSHTYTNNMPAMLSAVLKQNSGFEGVKIDVVATPAFSLADHTKTKTIGKLDKPYDYLVLQEQSEVSGFPQTEQLFIDSKNAMVTFAQAAASHSTTVILLQTWASQHGGGQNADIYPNYDVMQGRVDVGYRTYLDSIRPILGARVKLATVGDAWKLSKSDPTVFNSLYSEDGSHPAIAGSYLAALVVAKTIAGKLPAEPWHPAGISSGEAVKLRAIADSQN